MPATALEVLAVRWNPGGEGLGAVAVGHPGGHGGGELGKEGIGLDQVDFRMAVFAFVGGADSSAEVMDDVLQSVADAEDRQAESEDGRVGGRRVGVIHRAGAAGEDDADGMVRLDFVDRGGAGKDDGEDILFADAAGDELSILRAEVEDDDRRSFHSLVCQGVGGRASIIGG